MPTIPGVNTSYKYDGPNEKVDTKYSGMSNLTSVKGYTRVTKSHSNQELADGLNKSRLPQDSGNPTDQFFHPSNF